MKTITLDDLQASVQDKSAFLRLDDYFKITKAFANYIHKSKPTRIISPTHNNYIFYQYSKDDGYKITRPLNSDLFIESSGEIEKSFYKFFKSFF